MAKSTQVRLQIHWTLNITSQHIWKDRLHLNENGIKVLANNFLEHLNRLYDYDIAWG